MSGGDLERIGGATPVTVNAGAGDRWRAILLERGRSAGIIIAFLALFTALAIGSPYFATKVNLLDILDQQASTLVIACHVPSVRTWPERVVTPTKVISTVKSPSPKRALLVTRVDWMA